MAAMIRSRKSERKQVCVRVFLMIRFLYLQVAWAFGQM